MSKTMYLVLRLNNLAIQLNNYKQIISIKTKFLNIMSQWTLLCFDPIVTVNQPHSTQPQPASECK